jgi:hypothetical protein
VGRWSYPEHPSARQSANCRRQTPDLLAGTHSRCRLLLAFFHPIAVSRKRAHECAARDDHCPTRFVRRGQRSSCQADQNYDLVTDLANTASIALPQSLLNWKPKVAR